MKKQLIIIVSFYVCFSCKKSSSDISVTANKSIAVTLVLTNAKPDARISGAANSTTNVSPGQVTYTVMTINGVEIGAQASFMTSDFINGSLTIQPVHHVGTVFISIIGQTDSSTCNLKVISTINGVDSQKSYDISKYNSLNLEVK